MFPTGCMYLYLFGRTDSLPKGVGPVTTLQDRLFAGRAVRAAQEQEELARSLRPEADIPAQRTNKGTHKGTNKDAPILRVVPSVTD